MCMCTPLNIMLVGDGVDDGDDGVGDGGNSGDGVIGENVHT